MIFGRIKQVQTGNATCRVAVAVLMTIAASVAASGCIKPVTPPTPKSTGSGSSPATAATTPGNAAKETPATTADTSGAPATVNIEGSSTVYLIAQAMAVEFEKMGNYKVSLGRNGTGGGYKKFALRQCDLWNASRPIAEKEKAELKEKGIGWLELEVGIDGLSIAVNPKNDWCTELTVADLRKIWKPENPVNKWNELNPAWPDQTIDLFGADTDSGTFEYFTEVIVGKKGSSRTKYQAASDDNVLIQGVSRSKFALGYIPFGYCVENKDKVKLVKVSPTADSDETAAPAVEPTVDTILNGEYKPLSRPLYVYANTDAMKRPEVTAYLKFAISLAAQPLVAERGFVRIPEPRRQEMETRLAGAIGKLNSPQTTEENAGKVEEAPATSEGGTGK